MHRWRRRSACSSRCGGRQCGSMEKTGKYMESEEVSFMRRFPWHVAALLFFGFVCLPVTAEAQRPGKTFRVGHLSGSGATANKALTDAFRDEMR